MSVILGVDPGAKGGIAFGLSIWAFFISWKAALIVSISWFICNIVENVLKPKS